MINQAGLINGAGIIVYKTIENERFFLLLYSRWSRIWSVPKGHIEKGENPYQAACREMHEETMIPLGALHTVSDFSETITYRLPRPTKKCPSGHKTVMLYGAEMTSDVPIRLSKEHSKYMWCTSSQAVRILPSDFQDVVRKLISHIDDNKSN